MENSDVSGRKIGAPDTNRTYDKRFRNVAKMILKRLGVSNEVLVDSNIF
jgi:hypothetical protein